MPLKNFIQVFPIHIIQTKEMVLTKKGSIIFVVGKSTIDIMELIFV